MVSHWGVQFEVAGPDCEGCKQQMWWHELLRTWACRQCGYFLDYVCGHCGLLYDPPVSSCPGCGGKIPPSHRLPSGGREYKEMPA